MRDICGHEARIEQSVSLLFPLPRGDGGEWSWITANADDTTAAASAGADVESSAAGADGKSNADTEQE